MKTCKWCNTYYEDTEMKLFPFCLRCNGNILKINGDKNKISAMLNNKGGDENVKNTESILFE